MYIKHLSLTNFRNYTRLETALPDGPVVIHGENAQGKTSLLEAIYYLATSRSPYTTSDRQLINWHTESDPLPFARLAADVVSTRQATNRVEVTILLERGNDGVQRFKKRVRKNGVDQRVMDMIGLLNVVLFLPRDLTLVEGSPSDRRRFMDTTLSQINPRYAEALDAYDKALPQRNALLRRIADRQAAVEELGYWDDLIATNGAILIAARQSFLRELEVLSQREHYDLTGRRETLTLSYQPSFMPTAQGTGQMSFDLLGLDLNRDLDSETIKPQYLQQLQAEQREAIRRGVTLSGPHRDELRLLINERDAGLYGSRGQARTAVMSLKLAELTWMRDRTGEFPVLLLDEVAAELDRKRRAYLLERVQRSTQALLTTTELDIFTDAFLSAAGVWHVQHGQLSVERDGQA